jgi:hypothetical protein
MGSKLPDGKVVTTPLWQVKVWLKPKKGLTPTEFRKELVEQLTKRSATYPKIRRTPSKERLLYEVSIFDAHFGKLGWAPEVGENVDLKIAKDFYREGVEKLLNRVQRYSIERLLYPIGNDFLHTDNAHGTTTAGTPQDCDGRWQKAFMTGCQAIREGIEMMRQIAPVDVMVVPGNHDNTTMFFLGEVIKAVFEKCPDVNVNNAPNPRKYYDWGVSLLGFTHGNTEDQKELPRLMADEAPPEVWVRTRHREWHTGHFHKRKETRFVSVDTRGACVVRTLPSLTGADAWHHSKGYTAQRAAEGYLWCHDTGYVGHFSTDRQAA